VLGVACGLLVAWMEKHRVGASGAAWGYPPPERLVLAGQLSWFYVGKILWPAKLAFFYDRWRVVADAAGLLYPLSALLAVGNLWWRRGGLGRGPLAAVLFFGGTIFPVLGFLDVYPMQFSHAADHFQYLASIGTIALFAGALVRLLGARRAGVACAGIAVVLGALTAARLPVFGNQETLWRDTISRTPSARAAYRNLAALLVAERRPADAITVLEQARARGIVDADNCVDYGQALEQLGRADEALRHYEEAAAIDPRNEAAFFDLGLARERRRELDEAEAAFARVVALKPGDAVAWFHLGLVTKERGEPGRAQELFDRAISLDPRLREEPRTLR
jgi:tetratricopeptide (TPR) repeat protein